MTPTKPRLVLVTGATSGIGRATARAFGALGCDLILIGRRTDRLAALATEVPHVKIDAWTVDVRDRAALERGVKEREEALRSVDVVVNNAGLARGKDTLQDSRPEDWDEMIDTNIKGLLAVTRLVLPHMVNRGSGHVINLGSVTGRQVYRGGAVYAATKFGVRAITHALRHDVLGTGVRVSSIDPGLVETEFSVVRFRGDEPTAKRVYQDTRPLTPQDVAEAIVWTATRPAHVNVQEILLMPTDQADATTVHRSKAA